MSEFWPLLVIISILLPAYILMFLCRYISNRLCTSARIEESARFKLPMHIVLLCLVLSAWLVIVDFRIQYRPGILSTLHPIIMGGYETFVRPLPLMHYIDVYVRDPFFTIVLFFSQAIFILYGIITFVVIMALNYKNRRCSLLSLCLAYILSFVIADVIQFIGTVGYIMLYINI